MEKSVAQQSDRLEDVSLEEQQVDKHRAALYGILGRLFGCELTSEFAKELHQAGFFQTLAKVDPGFATDENLQSLDFEALEVEFARLFVGPGPHSSPYASVYREDDERGGQLWGSTTGEVKRFMAHYGLSLEKPGTIPDHISVLFEFMEKLLREKIVAFEQTDDEAFGEADRIQRQFFQDYVQPWVESFLERVLRADPLPFYAAVVKFTSQFVAQEETSI
jgi:TorA maturation chaperone TorD